MDSMYLPQRLMERHRRTQKELHMVFNDLEMTYDSLPREMFQKAIEKEEVCILTFDQCENTSRFPYSYKYALSFNFKPWSFHIGSMTCLMNISKRQCHNACFLQMIMESRD